MKKASSFPGRGLKVVHELHTISAPTQLKTFHNGTKVRAFRAGCVDMLFVRNDRLLIKKKAKMRIRLGNVIASRPAKYRSERGE